MAKRKDSRKTAKKKPQRPLNGATLRDAVAWAVDRQMFAHLKVHGNTAWQIGDLILLAVIWVWSNDATLTGAFVEAHRWSMDVLGRAALKTYQGFIKALAAWTASWVRPRATPGSNMTATISRPNIPARRLIRCCGATFMVRATTSRLSGMKAPTSATSVIWSPTSAAR